MTDETPSAAEQPPIEQRAKEMGWIPLEEFKGDKDKFISAEDFVQRGEQFIPFLRAREKKLVEQVNDLRTQLGLQQSLNRANAAAIAEVKATQGETTKNQLDEQIAALRAQIKQARTDNDLEREETLRDQLDDLREKKREAARPAPTTNGATSAEGISHPVFQEWVKDNPWWQEDAGWRAASLEVSRQLAVNGVINEQMPYRDRLDKVSEVMKSRYGVGSGNSRREEPARVESSRGGSSSNGSSRRYGDMPREAREACDSFAARLVGPDKKYKTIADWRADYAIKYFAEAQ